MSTGTPSMSCKRSSRSSKWCVVESAFLSDSSPQCPAVPDAEKGNPEPRPDRPVRRPQTNEKVMRERISPVGEESHVEGPEGSRNVGLAKQPPPCLLLLLQFLLLVLKPLTALHCTALHGQDKGNPFERHSLTA